MKSGHFFSSLRHITSVTCCPSFWLCLVLICSLQWICFYLYTIFH